MRNLVLFILCFQIIGLSLAQAQEEDEGDEEIEKEAIVKEIVLGAS